MTRNNVLSFVFAGVLLSIVMLTRTGYAPGAQPLEQISSAGVVSERARPAPPTVKRQSSAVVREGAVQAASIISAFPERKTDVGNPETSVRAAFVGDLDTPEVYFQKSASQNWAIASLTKLMTAVVAEEYSDGGRIIAITPSAILTEGAAGGFGVDEQYSIRDLIRAMLVASSNDAAVAIGEAYGTDVFVSKMNEKATTIGMTQTKFFDVTGLSPLNQSNVHDLSKLVRYIAQQHPDIFETTRLSNVVVTNQVTSSQRQIQSIIKFAGRPDFLGGKTGYKEEGVSNLISIFSHEGRRVVFIVLGATDQEARFTETEALLRWFKNSYIFE